MNWSTSEVIEFLAKLYPLWVRVRWVKSLTIPKKGTSTRRISGTQTLMCNNCSPYFLPSKLNNGYLEPKMTSIFEGQPSQNKAEFPSKKQGSLWILCRSPPGSPQRTPKPLVPGRRTLISTFQVIFHMFFGIFLGAPKQTNTKNIERKLGSEEDLSEICQLRAMFRVWHPLLLVKYGSPRGFAAWRLRAGQAPPPALLLQALKPPAMLRHVL